MSGLTLLNGITALLEQSGVQSGALAHKTSGMHLLRYTAPSGQDVTIYRPLLCLVLQGAKEVTTSTRTITVQAGQSLIVSHTIPVASGITQAAPECPYVALVLHLDLELLRDLVAAVPLSSGNNSSDPFSISLADTDSELEAALLRYLDQCETEEAVHLLAPITLREIHARLLMGAHAGVLRKLLRHESIANRIFLATRDIQSHLARPIVVSALAERVGMSNASFFKHFKAITGTSPLQYQKDLRLFRARDEVRATRAKVSEIAFSLGYESTAQFSREYSRKFGHPPREDRAPHPPIPTLPSQRRVL